LDCRIIEPAFGCIAPYPARSDQRADPESGIIQLGIPAAALGGRDSICSMGKSSLGIAALTLANGLIAV
jgi:hypothetical protein